MGYAIQPQILRRNGAFFYGSWANGWENSDWQILNDHPVKRNKERFPEDFIFQLTKEEFGNLKSQIVISSWGGLRRTTPYAFTEQGVAMLSSVLNSPRAIRVNIEIMRTFVKLRKILASHVELARKLEALERKYDSQFKVVFEAIRQLMASPEKQPKKIGFRLRENRATYGRR